MKAVYIIGMIFLSVVVKGECGVIDNVYGKVKNTTHAINEDIHNWWSYGKGFVFGENTENEYKTRVEEVDNAIDTTKYEIEREDGVFEGAYNKIRNRVVSVRKRIHDIILGQENGEPNKSFVRNLYDRVRNRISKTRVYILGEDNQKNQNETQKKDDQDLSDKTKVIRDTLNKILFEHNTKKLGETVNSSKDYVSEATDSVVQKVNNSVSKGKDTLEDTNKTLHDEVKTSLNDIEKRIEDAQEKENELMGVASNKIKDGVLTTKEKVGKATEDIKQLTYGVSSVVDEAKSKLSY